MLNSSHGKVDILHIPQNYKRGNFRQVYKFDTHTHVHREQADKLLLGTEHTPCIPTKLEIFLHLSVVSEETAEPCLTLTKLPYYIISFVD